jgi:hypothetical protein
VCLEAARPSKSAMGDTAGPCVTWDPLAPRTNVRPLYPFPIGLSRWTARCPAVAWSAAVASRRGPWTAPAVGHGRDEEGGRPSRRRRALRSGSAGVLVEGAGRLIRAWRAGPARGRPWRRTCRSLRVVGWHLCAAKAAGSALLAGADAKVPPLSPPLGRTVSWSGLPVRHTAAKNLRYVGMTLAPVPFPWEAVRPGRAPVASDPLRHARCAEAGERWRSTERTDRP